MKQKDLQRMIDALSWEGNALFDRYSHANKRADRLGDAANAYDNETIDTQTPEECARLDRMIALANRARRLSERLGDRRDRVMLACTSLEGARDLAKVQKARV